MVAQEMGYKLLIKKFNYNYDIGDTNRNTYTFYDDKVGKNTSLRYTL